MRALFTIGFDNVNHSLTSIENAKHRNREIVSVLDKRVSRSEFVALESCNRLEFYCLGVGFSNADYACLQADMQQAVGTMMQPYCLIGRSAVEKLFKTATGLYTPVLGDAQIFGQVKAAYRRRLATGEKLARELHQLFQGCFRASKKTIRESQLNHYPLSIAKITLNMLTEHRPTVRRMAILGTGQIAREVIACVRKDRALRETRVSVFYHANKGEWVSAPPPYEIRHLNDFRIESFDTVVTTLAVKDCFITQSSPNPVRIYDLGNPRNVDTNIKNQLNTIYDLASINEVAKTNADRRKQLANTASTLMEHEVERFLHRQKLREAFRMKLWAINPTGYSSQVGQGRICR